MKKLFIIFVLFSVATYSQTARFVSKSGNNIPPYTSWETACDSIRPVIDICEACDTVFIDSGVYLDSLDIDVPLTLIGKGIDETTIQGIEDRREMIKLTAGASFEGINFIGSRKYLYDAGRILELNYEDTLKVNNCKFATAQRLISNYRGALIVQNSFFHVVSSTAGILSLSYISEDAFDFVENCYFYGGDKGGTGIRIHNRELVCRNNTFFGKMSNNIMGAFTSNIVILENNIFTSYEIASVDLPEVLDTLIIRNNVFHSLSDYYVTSLLIYYGANVKVYNNIFFNNGSTYYVQDYVNYYSDYNCFYGNIDDLGGNATYGHHVVRANPMFEGEFDNSTPPEELYVQLQKFSPCIDAGKPDVFDPDGTRSDIGPLGGVYGRSYSYEDLPPLPPTGFNGENIGNNTFRLNWVKNSESDIKGYVLYSFSDSMCTNILEEITVENGITNYQAAIPAENRYYKLTAIDSASNESGYSNRVIVYSDGIVNLNEDNIPYEYKLYQNYPNPFNPRTRIRFSLEEEGFVKIKVFDTKGELVRKEKEKLYSAGGHEVSLNLSNFASGIYIVTLQVEQNGKPVFVENIKITLLK